MAALEITLLLLLFQITDFARTGSQLGEVGYFIGAQSWKHVFCGLV